MTNAYFVPNYFLYFQKQGKYGKEDRWNISIRLQYDPQCHFVVYKEIEERIQKD